MSVEHKSSLLMEARTSELEIVEFSLRDACYGINVAKAREIIKANIDLVPLADAHPSIQGAINLRGAIIPVVNLARHLKINMEFDLKQSRIIVAEFSRIVLGFLVGSVSRIHRISWKAVEVPSPMLQTGENYVSGIVRVDTKVIFLLDFEKVASHINPQANIQAPQGNEYSGSVVDRASKTILVVDDSEFTRKLILQHLHLAGYHTVTATNGEEAWNMLSALTARPSFENVEQFCHLMVTDIEMPQMDGLHLIGRIKADSRLKRMPCVAFSSIISKDVIAQCRKFGADAEISKPEIIRLVELVDSKVL